MYNTDHASKGAHFHFYIIYKRENGWKTSYEFVGGEPIWANMYRVYIQQMSMKRHQTAALNPSFFGCHFTDLIFYCHS